VASQEAVAGNERTAFLEAIEELLRPLMRLVLRYDVTYLELLEVVRALYISALRDQLSSQGRSPSVARLGIMAGVTRGEVEKIYQRRDARIELRRRTTQKVDDLALVLAKWHDDNRFSTPYGAPLDLSLQVERGFRTFDELLAAVNPSLDREAVIDSLVANGCIEVHGNKFVRCTNRAFLETGVNISKITRLGRIVGALNSTFAHNLLRDASEPAFVERTTLSHYPLSTEGRDAVLARFREEGREFVDGLDRWITGQEEEFSDASGRRCGVSVFFFEDNSVPIDAEQIAPAAISSNA
jgi:hypothetical protein